MKTLCQYFLHGKYCKKRCILQILVFRTHSCYSITCAQGKAVHYPVRGTTNTSNTYWREWDTEYSVLFLMAAFHLKEILKDMIGSSLLKIINSVRCLRIKGGPNLLNPHFGLGKRLNQFFQTLTIPEVTLATCLCNIQQLWGSQIMTGKSHRSPWK